MSWTLQSIVKVYLLFFVVVEDNEYTNIIHLTCQVPVFGWGANRARDCDDNPVHGQEVCSARAGGALCGVSQKEPAGRQCVHVTNTGGLQQKCHQERLNKNFVGPHKENTDLTIQILLCNICLSFKGPSVSGRPLSIVLTPPSGFTPAHQFPHCLQFLPFSISSGRPLKISCVHCVLIGMREISVLCVPMSIFRPDSLTSPSWPACAWRT